MKLFLWFQILKREILIGPAQLKFCSSSNQLQIGKLHHAVEIWPHKSSREENRCWWATSCTRCKIPPAMGPCLTANIPISLVQRRSDSGKDWFLNQSLWSEGCNTLIDQSWVMSPRWQTHQYDTVDSSGGRVTHRKSRCCRQMRGN